MTELEALIAELQRRVVYWQRLQAAFPPDNHVTHVDVAARILTYKECIEIVQDQLAVMAIAIERYTETEIERRVIKDRLFEDRVAAEVERRLEAFADRQ